MRRCRSMTKKRPPRVCKNKIKKGISSNQKQFCTLHLKIQTKNEKKEEEQVYDISEPILLGKNYTLDLEQMLRSDIAVASLFRGHYGLQDFLQQASEEGQFSTLLLAVEKAQGKRNKRKKKTIEIPFEANYRKRNANILDLLKKDFTKKCWQLDFLQFLISHKDKFKEDLPYFTNFFPSFGLLSNPDSSPSVCDLKEFELWSNNKGPPFVMLLGESHSESRFYSSLRTKLQKQGLNIQTSSWLMSLFRNFPSTPFHFYPEIENESEEDFPIRSNPPFALSPFEAMSNYLPDCLIKVKNENENEKWACQTPNVRTHFTLALDLFEKDKNVTGFFLKTEMAFEEMVGEETIFIEERPNFRKDVKLWLAHKKAFFQKNKNVKFLDTIIDEVSNNLKYKLAWGKLVNAYRTSSSIGTPMLNIPNSLKDFIVSFYASNDPSKKGFGQKHGDILKILQRIQDRAFTFKSSFAEDLLYLLNQVNRPMLMIYQLLHFIRLSLSKPIHIFLVEDQRIPVLNRFFSENKTQNFTCERALAAKKQKNSFLSLKPATFKSLYDYLKL